MPVFRSGEEQAPAWCEMEYFDLVRLAAGQSHLFERKGRKEKLVVCGGRCRVALAGETVDAAKGANLDLVRPDGQFEVTDVAESATLVRMAGRWGEETGDSGLFTVDIIDKRDDGGLPLDYAKNTSFDNHYHDADEYWIIYKGCGAVITEGKRIEVGPGDCVATGMGHHHDFPEIVEPVEAVFFQTTLEGRKRRGHLWTHAHGPAEPRPERV
jgi:mannose-6-phosphate isomerase-like protein (cupin superfamily)